MILVNPPESHSYDWLTDRIFEMPDFNMDKKHEAKDSETKGTKMA
jgi:hypothetical protein